MLKNLARPDKKFRHDLLRKIISENPMITDNELAAKLNVSISTVRLDRALLGVPELRERIKTMAQNAVSKLQSLSPSEVIGDLLELEPDKWALSVLKTARENKKYTKVDLCRELELLGVEMSRNEIYRIEKNQMIVKDFELVAFCIVLDINFDDLKKFFDL